MFCPADRKCPPGMIPYAAQVYDTFYKISRYYNITLDDLVEANPDIDPDNLTVGDMLCIPLSLQNINCPVGSEIYTIKAGDTIYKLSQRFNIRISTLLKANSRINPDALLTGQIIYIPKPWSKYSNQEYKIGFMYPSRWAKINCLHFEGVDGFFRISTLESDKSLEDICKSEAFHKLKPYGSRPNIVMTTAAGLNACEVIPSADQPTEMKRQAALIIESPKGLIIKGQTQSHLVLWADLEHLYDIKNSLVII